MAFQSLRRYTEEMCRMNQVDSLNQSQRATMLEYSREELWELSPELGEIRESDDESQTDENESQEKSPKNGLVETLSDKQLYKLNRRISSHGDVDYPPSLHRLTDYEENSPKERTKKRSLTNLIIRRGDSGTSFSSGRIFEEDSALRENSSNSYNNTKGFSKRASMEYSGSSHPRINLRGPSQDDVINNHDEFNAAEGKYNMNELLISERSEEEEGEVDYKPKILAKPLVTPKMQARNSGQALLYEDVDDNDYHGNGNKFSSSERLKTNEKLPPSLSQIRRIDEDDF
jgi:hypothetical protein